MDTRTKKINTRAMIMTNVLLSPVIGALIYGYYAVCHSEDPLVASLIPIFKFSGVGALLVWLLACIQRSDLKKGMLILGCMVVLMHLILYVQGVKTHFFSLWLFVNHYKSLFAAVVAAFVFYQCRSIPRALLSVPEGFQSKPYKIAKSMYRHLYRPVYLWFDKRC